MAVLNADKDFLLLSKAKTLVKHTLTMTDNTKRYPKKYRFSIVNRMQELSIDIYELINTANELNVTRKDELQERLRLQNLAITKCKTLIFFITISLENENIALNDSQAENWAKKCLDVKNMAVRWHAKDREKLY